MMPIHLALVLALLLLTGGEAALAQTAAVTSTAAPATASGSDTGLGGSFITPFPENDSYRLQVYGESVAEGLLFGMVELLAKEPRLQIQRKHRQIGNLLRGGEAEDLKAVEAELAGVETPHIAVVTPNMVYRFPWRENFDRRFPPNSEARREEIERRKTEWRTQYGARIDRLMRAFRKKSVAVYWLGMPIMRNTYATEDAQVINDLIRERALQNGGKFIDIFSSFADEEGQYSTQGPDIDGKVKPLREQDNFTGAGYRKLAHFLERELKRDMTLAKEERVIPLAGSEPEQKKVRPATTVPAAVLTSAKAAPGTLPRDARGSAALDKGPAVQRGQPADGSGDIRADNSRITLRSVSQQGKDDSITIDIIRPSIPAQVFAAVTRRESADKASQMGDAVVLEVRGGQTLVSSVTPSAETSGDRRRSGAANSPVMLVLEKGERLPAKPGRSDDLPWPRNELPPPAPLPAKAEKQPAPKGKK